MQAEGLEPSNSERAGLQPAAVAAVPSLRMVPRARLERATPAFVVRCSDPTELTGQFEYMTRLIH